MFINKEKSHFIPGGSGVSRSDDATETSSKSSKQTKGNDNKRPRKNHVITDSDSFDDLDFGDFDDVVPNKKRKSDGGKADNNCIVIDGSDIDDNIEDVEEFQ